MQAQAERAAFLPRASLDLPVNNTREAIKNNVKAAFTYPAPWMKQQEWTETPILIVAGGPSLEQNLPLIRQLHDECPILAVNGAYGYLLEHDIEPEYFILIDSRDGNVCHVRSLCERTVHYLATQVHPEVYWALGGHQIVKFNLGTEACLEALDEVTVGPHEFIPGPIGMGSIHAAYLAAALGHRRQFLFGYDFCQGKNRLYGAYDQPMNDGDDFFEVHLNGKTFTTTLAMARTAEQFRLAMTPLILNCKVEQYLYSDGLLAEILATADSAKPVEDKEREKYEAMWKFDTYRRVAPALRYVDAAIELLGIVPGQSILDLGCGTGRSTAWFVNHGYIATGIDIAGNALEESVPFIQQPIWHELPLADFAFSADVLEHVPEPKVAETLAAIGKAVRVGAYLNIDTIPDAFGVNIGQTLHMTVRPSEWWQERLERHFAVVTRIETDEDDRQAVFACFHRRNNA